VLGSLVVNSANTINGTIFSNGTALFTAGLQQKEKK
jgi:hypothetical protein